VHTKEKTFDVQHFMKVCIYIGFFCINMRSSSWGCCWRTLSNLIWWILMK